MIIENENDWTRLENRLLQRFAQHSSSYKFSTVKAYGELLAKEYADTKPELQRYPDARPLIACLRASNDFVILTTQGILLRVPTEAHSHFLAWTHMYSIRGGTEQQRTEAKNCSSREERDKVRARRTVVEVRTKDHKLWQLEIEPPAIEAFSSCAFSYLNTVNTLEKGKKDWDAYVAHKTSSHHRQEVENSPECGCFFCLDIFPPSKIESWIDKNSTALCPSCSIDSVIPTSDKYPLTKDFLKRMKRFWFGSTCQS